jgi:hypothetical protein
MEVSERSASHTGHFTLEERTPGTQWIWGWEGPRARLDAVKKRNDPFIPLSRIASRSSSPSCQPLCRLSYSGSYHCTQYSKCIPVVNLGCGNRWQYRTLASYCYCQLTQLRRCEVQAKLRNLLSCRTESLTLTKHCGLANITWRPSLLASLSQHQLSRSRKLAE